MNGNLLAFAVGVTAILLITAVLCAVRLTWRFRHQHYSWRGFLALNPWAYAGYRLLLWSAISSALLGGMLLLFIRTLR